MTPERTASQTAAPARSAAAAELAAGQDVLAPQAPEAPPVDGKANRALLAFLAAELGVPRASVSLVRGGGSRSKLVRVAQPG